MHLQRGAGLPAVKVVDIVDIARAAGRVIMDVYQTSPDVSCQQQIAPHEARVHHSAAKKVNRLSLSPLVSPPLNSRALEAEIRFSIVLSRTQFPSSPHLLHRYFSKYKFGQSTALPGVPHTSRAIVFRRVLIFTDAPKTKASM